ncbi:MAG: hypothetical protein JF612_11400 [Planctomycetia bacterium]|nr:hypothetical protein [Planctomycetia bacterium]
MKPRDRQLDANESRAAVALTVAWMLSCMSTAVGMLTVLALRLLMFAFPVAAAGDHPLGRIAGVLLFVALATGAVCVAFTPLVYRVRQAPPPSPITVGAVLIGISPIVLLIVLSLFQ